MSFFRNLFGLGPKEPVNVRPRTNASLVEKKEKVKEALVDIKERNIYPLLLSENTDIFDFDDDIISYYHDREGIFAEIIIGYIVLDEDNLENGEPITYQIRTNEKTEEEFDEIAHTAKINFDDFELPFIDWNENNQNFNFQILTCKVSLFSCEKILSKKHMMERFRITM